MGKAGQELSDPASSRRGPKRRAERLSQLSLAQFLFLLVPVSLPGAALPSVEEQPRWCSYPSSTPCCERPHGRAPLPSLRSGRSPWQCPHLQRPFREYFWSESSQDHVHSYRHGRPLAAPSGFLCPRVVAARVRDPLQRECSRQCFASLQRELRGTPPPIASRVGSGIVTPPGTVGPLPILSTTLRQHLFLRGNFPFWRGPWPQPSRSCGRSPRAGWVGPGWGPGWKMVVPGRSFLRTRGRAPLQGRCSTNPQGSPARKELGPGGGGRILQRKAQVRTEEGEGRYVDWGET